MNADRWVALISLVITVGAVVFSIWAYRRGEKYRVPTGVTAPSPEVLIKPVISRLAGFSVTYKGQPVGNNGVTALFIYFWNDGQLPILQSDVIAPYTIVFPKEARILDLNVTKSTRPILGIEAQVISDGETDSVALKFAVLEPGDGLKLQIIFDGPADSQVTFEGSCIGSAKVRVLTPDWTYFVNRGKRFEGTYMPVVMALTLTAIAACLGGILNWLGRFVKPSFGRPLGIGLIVLFGGSVFWAISVVLFGWYKKWTASSVPPEIRNS
jgi:hypothetical protein